MKKLFAVLSAVFFACSLSVANVWAADPEPETLNIDRHAVWTKIIEDNTKKDSNASENKTAEASDQGLEKQSKMDVRMKDLPWQRIG